MEILRFAYETTAQSSQKDSLSFNQVINGEGEEHEAFNERYTSRLLATREEAPSGHVFLNGKYMIMSPVSPSALLWKWADDARPQQWMAFVQQEISRQTLFVQEEVCLSDQMARYDLTTFR